MKLQDRLPVELEQALQRRLSTGEALSYCLASDLTVERAFGQSYLACTSARVFVLSGHDIVLELRLGDIEEVVVDELFRGGRLVARMNSEQVALVCYTKALVPQFGVFCRVLNELIRGVPVQIPDEEEGAWCIRCGAPLPERGEACALCVPRWTIFKRLLGLLRPYRGKALLLTTATALTVVAQMVPPYVTKRIVDDVIKAQRSDLLAPWIAAMLGAAVLFLLARLCSGMLSTWLAARVVSDLRERLHSALQRLQLGYFTRRSSGVIVSRTMHDTQELQQFLVEGMPFMMVNAVLFVGIATILVRLDAKLAMLVFLPVPFLVFGAEWFWKRLDPLFHRRGSTMSALHSVLSESINGIRVVKAFAQEERRTAQFNRHNEKLTSLRFSIDGTFIGFEQVMFWIMQVGIVGVWYFAARRIAGSDPNLSLGDLLAFVGYIWLLYGPLQWFTAVLNWRSRTSMQEGIAEGQITVNRRRAKASTRVKHGDTVEIAPRPDLLPPFDPSTVSYGVLYEDDYLLVIDKPPHLVVHPTCSHLTDNLITVLQARYKGAAGPMGPVVPRPAHRIDANTSGVLLLTKQEEVRAKVGRQFARRTVRKESHALAHGAPASREFRIDAPIGVDPSSGRRNKRIVAEGGLPSVTDFTVIADLGGCSLISARPLTGRTHQIRVHLAHAGHPILCDKFYGRESTIRRGGEAILDRHALHSSRLVFDHPVTGARMEVSAPHPPDMRRAMEVMEAARAEGADFRQAFDADYL